MDSPLPRPTDQSAREALSKRLDAEIARGLADLASSEGSALDDALDSLWDELGPPGVRRPRS